MEVKGTFKMEFSDYKAFCKFHRRKVTQISYVFMLVLTLTWLQPKTGDQFVIGILGILIAFAFIFVVDMIALHQSCKRMFNSAPLSKLEVENVINEGGFHQTSSVGNTDLTFEQFFKICETKDAFYLYISKIQAFIMPKQDFASEEEIENLKKILRDKVEKKKLKLQKG